MKRRPTSPTPSPDAATAHQSGSTPRCPAMTVPPADPSFPQFLDALPQLACLVDAQGRIHHANQAWQQQQPSVALTPALIAHWTASREAGHAFRQKLQLSDATGRPRWFLAQGQPLPACSGHEPLWLISFTDVHQVVSDRQRLTQALAMQRNMLDASVDCIKTVGTDGLLAGMNRSGCVALGVPEDSDFGMEWLGLLPEEVRGRGRRALKKANKGQNARFPGMSVNAGKVQYWDNILTPVLGADGQARAILCVSRDVTQARQVSQRLREASELDDLTGLPNRRSFKARLRRTLARSQNTHLGVGLLLLDLDHFKHVNDTLGHAAGDHLLRVLARRLHACLPANAFIARLGGDEFAVVAEGLADVGALIALAKRIQSQFEAPISYSGNVINGSMSIGCALAPGDAGDASGLMKCADTALNDIKAGGRGGVRMFSARMMQVVLRTAAQLKRAREIARNGSIQAHYQPKVQLEPAGQVLGFEALLRWTGENGRLHRPRTIMEAFKDYELATRIGDVMRQRIFSDMRDWLADGLPVLPVSFNVAPAEFLRDDFSERLLADIAAFQIPQHLVEIEVTEQVLSERGADFVRRALVALKRAGIRIALDDFGTGQSSFTRLRDYPVDSLKIDADFVRRIEDDPAITAIIHSVCLLGPGLGLTIVAEGVETAQQHARLVRAGCHVGQGYLFSQAVAAQHVRALLAAPWFPERIDEAA